MEPLAGIRRHRLGLDMPTGRASQCGFQSYFCFFYRHIRHFRTRPESIRLAVMLCIRFPHSLRNVEDRHAHCYKVKPTIHFELVAAARSNAALGHRVPDLRVRIGP